MAKDGSEAFAMNRAITFPNRAKRLPVDEPIIPLSAPCFNGNEWR